MTSTRASSNRPVEPVRILGIDPGSRVTGWGCVDARGRRIERFEYGCLRPPRAADRARALHALSSQLGDLVTRLEPEIVVVETPFFARFAKAALALAEARGALLAVLGGSDVTVVEYEPAKVKAAIVGVGNAEKRQVAYIVRRELGIVEELPPDAADALALAVFHVRVFRLDG